MSQPSLSSSIPNVNRLRRILDATKLLHSTIDLTKLTTIILDMVREEIAIDRCTVFVIDTDRHQIVSLVAQGVKTEPIRLQTGTGIAGYVAEKGEALDILNAYADSRFNPMIDGALEYRTKDIFCMPIRNRESRTVGVLELLNRQRPFTADDIDFLQDISVHMGIALENAWLHRQLLEKRKMEQELTLAAEIQRNFVPSIPQICGGVQVAASTTMCKAVGGDYLEYYPLGSGRFILMLGDVSGKGIGAALVMTSMHSTCRALLRHTQPLERIALVLNESLIETTKTQTYVTLIAVLVDAAAGKMHCIRAGHHPPLLVARDGTSQWLEHGGGLPIGLFTDLKVSTETYEIAPGMCLILYTDGITEGENAAGEHFGLQRLNTVAVEHHTETARSIHDAIRTALSDFTQESSAKDDTTLVVMKF